MNEHGIAETEETVFFLDGDFISFQDFFPRRQGADEHEQRRFGKMEIRDQRVDDMEGEARIDEDIRPARSGLQSPRRAGAFQGADAGRTDGDDSAAFGFGLVDGGSGFRRDAVEFTVHLMVFDIFFFYRPEGPQADVEGDEDFFYAFIAPVTLFALFTAAGSLRTGLVLLVCVLIGHLLTGQLMKPIEEMAEHLDDGSRSPAYRELEPFADKIRNQHENILAAAKSRQDFTANVSHELKTPITAISGYAELIENRLIDSEAEVHVAGAIRHNADRLLSLVTDIIQLSELDHRELPRKFEQIDLLAVANECVNDFIPMASQKNIKLFCSGISAGINADRILVREMIDNLLQNAIRYNKENGTVKVHVTIENGHPIISVEDTGIGIPADQLDRVFERFYRVDKSRSRETGGTGLGLAIVKHIAELHSAEIAIDSVVNNGTKISIRF